MKGNVRLEYDGGVARLTLARPDRGNSIDTGLARDLLNAAIACDEDASVRCVLLTGAGRMFCVGGDIQGFIAAGERVGGHIKELTALVHAAVATFARMTKPLVTAVNGPAAGAGFSLAILGDIALASCDASFTLGYAKIGLSPDGGATWLLPRLIGLRRAQELCLRGLRLTAHQAAELGLITRVVDANELSAAARDVALDLAAGPTAALGAARSLLLSASSTPLEAHLEHERRLIAAQASHPEGVEGVRAFVEKRPAEFPGSSA